MILALLTAGAGVVDIWMPLPDPVAVLLAATAAALAGWDYARYRRALSSTEFQNRASDSFEDVRQTLASDTRYEIRTFKNGSVICDLEFSRRLIAGQVLASVCSSRYSLPVELSGLGPRYIEHLHAQGVTLFPGPVLGMASNLAAGDLRTLGRVELRRGNYYDHVRSDVLATVDVIQNGRASTLLGRRFFVDRRGRLRDFGDSWLLNGIGTSMLAFTSDGKLLTLSQSEANKDSRGLLAPAGSGILEPQDCVDPDGDRLDQVVLRGGRRELCEEAGVRIAEVQHALVLGFGRWVEKAGRPEFYSVCFLSVDSHELERRRIARPERGFIRRRRFFRLDDDRTAWAEGLSALLPDDARTTMSVPLAMSLALLLDRALTAGDPVAVELTNRRILAGS